MFHTSLFNLYNILIKRYYYLVVLCLFLPIMGFSQSTHLKGKVIDADDQSPLIGAHIKLTNKENNATTSIVADKEGRFSFPSISIGKNYNIEVSYVGYEAYTTEILMDAAEKDLGTLSIKQGTAYLKEVRVVGIADRVEQKGDTTIYNADAFKTAPDASAEDLVRKMPGITTENGTVKAQGEDVKRVLIDGKRFFGDDPNMALRNLPSEIVERVQVFDQLSDQAQFTGFDDGESVRTINIITRNRVQNGTFGRVSAGYGTDDKYAVGGNINFFKDDHRWTVLGQTNNVNQQNFSNEDLMGMMSSSGPGRGGMGGMGGGRPGGGMGGGMRGGPPGGGMGFGSVGNFMVGAQNGLTTTNSLGVNYSGKPTEKLEVNGSYFFNQSENQRTQSSVRNYFLPGMEDISLVEDNISSNKNLNHRFNMRVEYAIDTNNSIIISPRLTFQGYESISEMLAERFSGTSLLSDTLNRNTSNNTAYTFSNDLLYRHRFNKPRRTMSLNLRTSINDRSGEQFQESGHPLSEEISEDHELYRQRTDNDSKGYNYNVNVNFTEPIGKLAILQMSYGASYSKNNSDRYAYVFNEAMGGYTDQDSLFSNVYQNDYLTQQLGLSYSIRKNTMNLSFGLDQQWAALTGERLFPVENSLDKNFQSLLPSASLNYRFKNMKNVNIRYRTRTNAPSVTNLQDVIDNSNPTRLSMGNPALDQDYRHDLFIRYGGGNAEKATSFFVFLGGGITDNYITRATYIAQKDTMIADNLILPRFGEISYPVNMDGYWNIRSFSTYGMPVNFLKSNLNLNASVSFSRIPGMINEVANFTNSLGLGAGFTLSSNISEKVDFTISTMGNYNIENNTNQINTNSNYWSQTSSGRFNLTFWKDLVFRTDLTHQMYNGLSSGYDQSYYLWNISLGKKLFKNKNGEIRASVADVLNNNQSITHNVTESYTEDVISNVMKRYAMISFTYNIRSFK